MANMSLKPVLKLKVDELFLRWLSEEDTQQFLQDSLRQMTIGGDGVSAPSSPTSKNGRPLSPRQRGGSPPYSPPPGLTASPRRPSSPRKHRDTSKPTSPGDGSCREFQRFTEARTNGRDAEKGFTEFPALVGEMRASRTTKLTEAKPSRRTPVATTTNTKQQPSVVAASAAAAAAAAVDPVPIPRFYFPQGRSLLGNQIEAQLQRVAAAFGKFGEGKVTREDFGDVAKACGCPLYWKVPLYLAAGGEKHGHVTVQTFTAFWKKLISSCHDDASKFVLLLAKTGSSCLVPEDFFPLIQDVVDTHPGLSFLSEAKEFHSRYVHTVIARIYYCVNRSWTGRISVPELRKSNFLQVLALLEEENDINQITDYFSYEHFYVVYCKFWELDKDHDLFISKYDLRRHNDHALSARIVDRIFSGAVTRGQAQQEGRMSYSEFVWFLISEEDKRNARSIEYWFRCMDLDGDGMLSMYELEYFYEEQLQRMEALGIETLPFEDCLCQMLDMVKPKGIGAITLSDLKRCQMTPVFFDTFFNLEKYLDHEQRDPFASSRDEEGPEMSDWEKYAAEEYELLVAEEGATEPQDDVAVMYDDDFEPDDDDVISTTDVSGGGKSSKSDNVRPRVDDDDEGDYAEGEEYDVKT
ncbi:PREDICTED: serine/threonine-protein phosphatase 2A regulatory subunit B'' subunit beta-like isoform X2 [Priapulus caudatus]|nr:PREDICTED: serine/threonine-protein phosphatase 2A regulatory subunit B'' subunit beta-like isoform X2 [Priapulus caudatus]XP_014671939.1 PREDICTED: serine/threonine-protein phosphatase 2A regulatory subunit B'' subunit beta-like isoform X2 [Priapulus caudatus]